MCLDGEWLDNAFADNPICGGSSGGTTARSNSQALTEDDASISVAYCAASGASDDCSSSFVGVNKNTGQCYCVKSMDCDSGNGDANVLKTDGHYMFANEPAPGLPGCVFGVVASSGAYAARPCASRM